MESSTRLMKFHLFNCDNTYNLDSVENLLRNMESKYDFKILVEKRYFLLQQISEMCETTIPKLQMDFAIFVVHAHESRLSINEDNAGIGYARFYRALLQATGGRVLIVIGGDDQYRGEDEERTVISRWARRKVASQFNEECLDGRRSFIFSWSKQHREIHEEALLHYFDPSKIGEKFEYQPKPKPLPLPDPKIISPPAVDSDEEPPGTDENRSRRERPNHKKAPGVIPHAGNAPADYPEGIVLLDTHMHYGEISYDDEDVQIWDQRWRASEKFVRDLERDWRLIPVAKVSFITNDVGGVCCNVMVVQPSEGFLSWLFFRFISCLRWFFEKVEACVNACFIFCLRWCFENITACVIGCFIFCLRWCFENIKACVTGCWCLIWAMLILFYEWLREKWQNVLAISNRSSL